MLSQGEKCFCSVGIDIHQEDLYFHVQNIRGDSPVEESYVGKSFYQTIPDCINWIRRFDPDVVVMESTGCYYQSLYNLLELACIPAVIVNPRHVRGMQGKKTDESDAKWLSEVGLMGAYTPSYIPPFYYRNLREMSRQAIRNTNAIQSIKNRISKEFNLAGYRLNLVFSDVFGKNAMIAKREILAGTPPEKILSKLQLKRLKASKEVILSALSGKMTPELKYTIESNERIMNCLKEEVTNAQNILAKEVMKHDPEFYMLLMGIPGWNTISTVNFIIEVGGKDFVNSFRNPEAFASWLGVCPGNNESAGKRKSGRCRKGNSFLRRTLCEVAQAAVRAKDTTFSNKYQSLVIRLRAKKSIFAIAHHIAKLIYHLVKNMEPYEEKNVNYQEKSCRKNARRWLKLLSTNPEIAICATINDTGEIFESADGNNILPLLNYIQAQTQRKKQQLTV